MFSVSKSYSEFPADQREKIAADLNPAARQQFIAGKLDIEILEFNGEGVRAIECAIAEKKRQVTEAFAPDLEALAWAKKWAAEPVIVIPADLAA